LAEPLLKVRNLVVHFETYAGTVKVLDGVSFDINEGETLGLVGETGCGKSVTALSILRLIDRPGKIVGGEVWLDGENLLEKSEEEMRRIRGKKISAIFQDPTTYLNPVYTIGDQVGESILQHQDLKSHLNRGDISGGVKRLLAERILKSLRIVKMPDPENAAKRYPHELSTGMRQRALTAMMVATYPKLLIADEPTTALDVTIQAQIMKMMDDLKHELGVSILLITHDLGLVARMCDRVAVMYAGNIVELASVDEIFNNPKHPYVDGLLKAIPRPGRRMKRLETIVGSVPNLINPPSGCRFHPRCPHVMQVCRSVKPELEATEAGHLVACHLYDRESQL